MAEEDPYRRLVIALRLLEVVITGQSAELIDFPGPPPYTPKMDGPHYSWDVSDSWEEGSRLFIVQVGFGVNVSEGESPPAEADAFFTSSVSAAVIFRTPKEMEAEEEHLDEVARIHGVMVAYPYVRASIQRMASEAGLERLTMPLFPVAGIEEDAVDLVVDDDVGVEYDGNDGPKAP